MDAKKVILIVDDTPENLRVLGDMLELEGYEVLVATNGSEALENARAIPPPDLILLDIMMPGMDGYEVCRRLKASAESQRIPVIFISALGLTDQKVQAFREGAVDYVSKPFQAEEVVARVHTHLQLASMDQLRHEVAERRRAEEAMQEQAEELSAIYENAPFVMMILDESGRVRKINNPITALSPIPLAEIVGRHICDVIGCRHAPMKNDTGQSSCTDCAIIRTLMHLAGTGTVHHQEEATIRRIKNGREQELCFLLSAEQLKFRHQPAALVCLLDISEQRQLREQMMQQQKLESLGLLVGGIAHDFNNMLLPIFCYAEMIRSKLPPDDAIHGLAGSILETAAKAKNLVQQLLSFSRKRALSVQSQDLNLIVSPFLKMLGSTLRGNITIRQELSTAPCYVRVDSVQVEQVILNLAVNAQDAITDKGTITVGTGHAVLDAEYCRLHPGANPGNYVVLAFTDSGSGMDETVLSQIFDPFFTTKPVGQGTGLGLSTIFGIVQQHNGYVEVQSRVGEGTTFRVYLPEDEVKMGGAEDTMPEARGKRPTPANILLVDDDPVILKLVRLMLEAEGHTVLVAGTPEAALALAREAAVIDLLVTDVNMPEMSGPRLYERLQKERPELKVLFMSGYPCSIEASWDSPDKAPHFIAKPFSAEAFLMQVSDLLE